MSRLRHPAPWVFLILLASFAYFWQNRDWNSASRLMLTYALADRGTIRLDGMEEQTGDIAFFEGHYYTDKLPGFSLLAVPVYLVEKGAFGLPGHPLNRPGFAWWPADYGVTLGTSGLLTALTGALLVVLARDLGCGPRGAALIGVSYGLATPAYAYATMSYGHQASAFALLASFALLWRGRPGWVLARAGLAGFLAAYASVIELQVGPVSAILGLYLIARVVRRQAPPSALATFALGAAVPTLVLLGYNVTAFGSPWDMGYFHEALDRFAGVHSAENPLGLREPRWDRAWPLLWGGYRGLLFYAPVVALAVPGWIVLGVRKQWSAAVVSLAVVLAVFLVNLSYPEWTGGWSTGPRLLVPMLPFAMLPAAAAVSAGGRLGTAVLALLGLAGAVRMLLFVGAGARIPEGYLDPFGQVVWPLWTGGRMPPGWPAAPGERFARNAVSVFAPGFVHSLPIGWQWLQFLPLIAFQVVALSALLWACRPAREEPRPPAP